jgi:exopolysaccharide biosynthesis polyprenyl glycosylphosphotransferase
VGLLDPPDEDLGEPAVSDARFPHYPLPTVAEFERIARREDADRVLIGFSRMAVDDLLEIIQVAKLLELKITVVPRLFEMIGHSVEVDQVEGMTLLGVRGFARTRSSLALKRLLDVSGAAAGLLVLSPLLAVMALAIKLTSSGPVFFRQERIGRDNEPFTLLKFRTMVDGADALKPTLRHLNEADGVMFKIADDPRVTKVGRHLRRTSIDELPQLLNVLRGEMSLVGPRPLVPDEDGQVIGWHRARLELTPGLTGPWQVMGRTNIPFQEMVALDYLYVAEWSLWNDIKLLIRTAPVVVLGGGT